ncbi:hypothetical protein ARMGADRAFT_1093124 [Armillaria gallica]|uniref:Zn(2)-C6 fungal-type domain-containing protein n=1 Tax=Armillaria gallica TaxID=47427 RepID=A0A2H3C8P8_ARMGA|nr:hypothetical protein ARMGADRAFT_1093124 [Armillaria gallica]
MTPPPVSKPTTPPPQKEKTPAPRKQQSTAPVTPQRSVPQRTPDLVGSVPRLDLLVAKSAANASSSGIRAAGLAPINIVKPPLPKFTAFLTAQKTGQPTASQRKVTPKSPKSSNAFQKDWTSPLHSKPAQQLQIGSSVNATRSEMPTRASSRALAIDAAARPNVILGPDPTLTPLQEGNVLVPLSDHKPLFLPGTDNEEEQVQGNLVTGNAALFEDDGLANKFSASENNSTGVAQHEQMDVDGDEPQNSDEDLSPPPTNKARHLRQEPRISFIFDDTTGDLVEPHPTIFLSRPAVPPSQRQDLRRSARSHTSLTHPTAAYFKAVQSSKPDAKKHRRDTKNKDKTSEVAVPRKHARTEDEALQTVDKPALKKLKSKDCHFDEVEVVRATPVIRRRGPRLSKPPPVTLGVRGGGFGEKVPSTAKAVRNGIKSIGVLKVDQDFGEFVEIDKGYWSKAVTPFVGERYTTACDHCRHLGTQCRKLLTHTVKCIRCHYSKLPCKVDGVAALNPVEHYRPRGYDAVNTFESALNAIEANNTAVSLITQQYLAGLSVVAHTDSICAQLFHLCGCLAPVEDEEDDNNDEGEEDEAPDDVAEGESGPSKKRKHRSG